jgi:hypothetical protein
VNFVPVAAGAVGRLGPALRAIVYRSSCSK